MTHNLLSSFFHIEFPQGSLQSVAKKKKEIIKIKILLLTIKQQ
jgi:hypothetical protein